MRTLIASVLLVAASVTGRPAEADSPVSADAGRVACGSWGRAVEGEDSSSSDLCFGDLEAVRSETDTVVPEPPRDVIVVWFETISCAPDRPCLAAIGYAELPATAATFDPLLGSASLDGGVEGCPLQASLTAGDDPDVPPPFVTTSGVQLAGGRDATPAGTADVCGVRYDEADATGGTIGIVAAASVRPPA